MAYVRSKRIKGYTYYYLVSGHRQGISVKQVVERYLGKNPWGSLHPTRFIHAGNRQYYPRLLKNLHDQLSPNPKTDVLDEAARNPYAFAHRLAHEWYDRYPELQFEFEQVPEPVTANLSKLSNHIPEGGKSIEADTPHAQFAHLVALCLTQPDKAYSSMRHASRWLLDAFYQEPELRAALTKVRLWQLADNETKATRRGRNQATPTGLYSGAIDMRTKNILGYTVISATEEGYRLRGKRGAEYELRRHKREPTRLLVKNSKGNACTLKGFRRFTDKGGTLRTVIDE